MNNPPRGIVPGTTPNIMNNARRKEIEEITAELEALKERIEALQEEELDAFENLPESIRYGERGEKMHSAIDYLEYAAEHIRDSLDNLSEASE